MPTTRVDLHVKVLNDTVIRRAKAADIDVLVYAPHFTRLPTIRERAATYSDDDILVVPAREVFTGSYRDRKHVLAIGLEECVPDYITLDGALTELARQDAAVLAPHPGFLTVSLTPADIEAYRDRIDAVETYNPKHAPHNNRRARRLADTHGMPAFGSSYAHLAGTVGEVWTTIDTTITSGSELTAALRDGVSRTVDHDTGLSHYRQRIAEKLHLGYENTWEKLDRVVLSGMERTHPRQVAYDGRFDDVAVY
ncbi:PHP-associated domain-containing protein [Halobacterium salinarum]|uniref:PHP-associated domain-containing protein n=1 Tax=Halobacterium salinarum TaxID=2242 RepID=UPI0025568DD4|nr:PHP domain-containing protein [Halobacterium salinarum]MDL0126999.1 PHP domain-containing protein [Halobacterium salinarum]